MSRFDQPTNEPDYDRYEPKPVEDMDVPDFDAPDPPVDPAEHAAHALIDALSTLEKAIAETQDLERACQLKELTRRAWRQMDKVDSYASGKIDLILERRR